MYAACGRRGCVERALSKFVVRGASFPVRVVIRSSTSASSATLVVGRCRGRCPGLFRGVCELRG